MKEYIIAMLGNLPREIIMLILSVLPVSELRGAIPYGLHQGMPLMKVFVISIAGNLLPVIPLYFLLNKIFFYLQRFTAGKRFSNWIVKHTLKKSKVIQIYEMLGLIIFVGIPLPLTGAWTGTIAAVLFKLKTKYYLIGIISGVFLAAVIVSSITLFIFGFIR